MRSPKRRFQFRKERSGKKCGGTAERPRLFVARSLKHIQAQLIDDISGATLLTASSLTATVREQHPRGGNNAAARMVGQEIARLAKDKGIVKVVFDRGGRIYHGRVKALAEGAREGGLEF